MSCSLKSVAVGTLASSLTAIASLSTAAARARATPTVPESAAPPYEQVQIYETVIPATDDPADVYYPVPPDGVESGAAEEQFPLALMLQGAFVDKSAYSNFARGVAQYGFVVVVPNHERRVFNPRAGEEVVGLVSEQRQVHDVLDFIDAQDDDPTSPIAGLVDPERFALLGHSIGGFTGISAIRGSCLPLICSGDSFQPPPQLDVAVFYGTSFESPPESGTFPPIDNEIPVALIGGSDDGEATYERVFSTYEQLQPPKVFILVAGANHYGITNDNSDRAINPGTLEQPEAIAAIVRWTGQFLRAYLWNDADALGSACDGNEADLGPVSLVDCAGISPGAGISQLSDEVTEPLP